jgi:hypothetical protein
MFLGKAVKIEFHADGIDQTPGKTKPNQIQEIRMKKTSVIASRRLTRLFTVLQRDGSPGELR